MLPEPIPKLSQIVMSEAKLMEKTRSLKGLMLKLVLAPFAVLFVVTLIAIRPIVKIMIYKVCKHRIGHFVWDTGLLELRARANRKNGENYHVLYYFPDSATSNFEVERLWRQELRVISGSWGWLLYEIMRRMKFLVIKSTTIDFDGLIPDSEPLFRLSPRDTRESLCNRVPLPHTQEFVTLHVRDAIYETTLRSMVGKVRQDARNSEITTYIEAAEFLANRGYYVFRMGSVPGPALITNHEQVIDYRNSSFRDEKTDVYLGALCKFCVSTSSGWDSIPLSLNRPVIFVNLVPFFNPAVLSLRQIFFPKLIKDANSDKVLSFSEILERDAFSLNQNSQFTKLGLVSQALSSEELVEAVTEMAQRVEGTFVETPEQKEMQAKARHILSTHPKLQPTPNYYPIRAQLASCFLSRYPNFLK